MVKLLLLQPLMPANDHIREMIIVLDSLIEHSNQQLEQ